MYYIHWYKSYTGPLRASLINLCHFSVLSYIKKERKKETNYTTSSIWTIYQSSHLTLRYCEYFVNIAKTIPESYQLRNDQEVCAPHGIRKCQKGQLLLSNNLQEMKNQRIKELGGIRMENILSYFRPNMNVKELSLKSWFCLKYSSQICHTWISNSFDVKPLSKQTSQTLVLLLYFTHWYKVIHLVLHVPISHCTQQEDFAWSDAANV